MLVWERENEPKKAINEKTNEQAARFVRWRLHEPHLGARSLALQAFKRGSVDNITVLVINLSTIA